MPEEKKLPKEMELKEGETLRIRVTVTDPETDDADMAISTNRSDDYVRSVLIQLCYAYDLVCVPKEYVSELGDDVIVALSSFLEEAEDEIPVFEDENSLFNFEDGEEDDEDS